MYQDIFSHFGGVSATAEALDVTQATASGWKKGGHSMSFVSAIRAQHKTANKFLARDLCPSIKEMEERLQIRIVFIPESSI